LGYESEWEEFVERLARNLTPVLKRRLNMAQLERLRRLGPPSDKLVYLYLVRAEPQTFTEIRQGLEIGVKTVDRALRRLRERGYVVQDRKYMYWVEGVE
jgi:DNA-binding MarR family transcriptional regulator